MISASIIADSINPIGIRLTTFILTYPRFIHAEIMTHRAISRNSASSRAIPVEKMLADVRKGAARPEFWAANQSGMQAVAQLEGEKLKEVRTAWKCAAADALAWAEDMSKDGAHKAIANRVLEPFSHITVVATASSWVNFFALRAHPMAQQEFQVLAYRMLDAYLKSAPSEFSWGRWHLPFIHDEDWDFVRNEWKGGPKPSNGIYRLSAECEPILARVSAARCARVSYLTHDGVRSIDKDLELYDRLVGSKPLHASALEHPAVALMPDDYRGNGPRNSYAGEKPSNFHPSWRQLRKTLPGENVTELNLADVLANKPEWITL